MLSPLLTPAPLDLHAPTTQKRFSQQIRALPLPDRRLVKIQCRHRQRSQPAPSLLSRSPHPRLIPPPGSRFGAGIPASRRPRPPAGAHKTSEPLSTPGITVSLEDPASLKAEALSHLPYLPPGPCPAQHLTCQKPSKHIIPVTDAKKTGQNPSGRRGAKVTGAETWGRGRPGQAEILRNSQAPLKPGRVTESRRRTQPRDGGVMRRFTAAVSQGPGLGPASAPGKGRGCAGPPCSRPAQPSAPDPRPAPRAPIRARSLTSPHPPTS